MIAQVLNRAFVESKLHEVIEMLEQSRQDLQAATPGAQAQAAAHGVTADDLEQSRESVETLLRTGVEKTDLESVSISRDPVASIVQSALEAFFEEAGAVADTMAQGAAPAEVAVTDVTLRPEWAAPGQKLGAALDSSDARWVLGFLAARGVAGLRGKRAFPSATPSHQTIANKTRLVLVGDWGSGLKRARAVANQMRTILFDDEGKARERHVIHLGDVYYSGFEREYRNRFLPYWPVEPYEAKEVGSWSLNGNHDMFSGGYGYFDCLLKDSRFARQGGASHFCLENDHWQIFGLDSAYDLIGLRGEEGDLYGPQAGWLATRRAASPHKKTLLLSHHQLFSAYEGGSPKMEARLQPILKDAPATAWFWGHEHLCAVYKRDTHPFVHCARLIGHGGVPVAPRAGHLPAGIQYEFRDSMLAGINRFTRFGFAVLDFDEGNITVRYINELGGEPHHTEVIA
jgi:hypothetical protein